MKLKYTILGFLLVWMFEVSAQDHVEYQILPGLERADELFNEFKYHKAAVVYKKRLEKEKNKTVQEKVEKSIIKDNPHIVDGEKTLKNNCLCKNINGTSIKSLFKHTLKHQSLKSCFALYK